MRVLDILCFFLIIVAALLFISAWPFEIGKQFDLKEAFSTLVAAFAGAYGAQIILEKNKGEERIIQEIRNINASIMLAFSMWNYICSVKNQHVKSLKEKFAQDRNAIIAISEQNRASLIPPGMTVTFTADFQTFQKLTLPTDILLQKVFDHLSAKGRILSLVTMLTQSVNH